MYLKIINISVIIDMTVIFLRDSCIVSYLRLAETNKICQLKLENEKSQYFYIHLIYSVI